MSSIRTVCPEEFGRRNDIVVLEDLSRSIFEGKCYHELRVTLIGCFCREDFDQFPIPLNMIFGDPHCKVRSVLILVVHFKSSIRVDELSEFNWKKSARAVEFDPFDQGLVEVRPTKITLVTCHTDGFHWGKQEECEKSSLQKKQNKNPKKSHSRVPLLN